MERLLRVEEAAKLLGTTDGQLRQRIFKKQVPARKLGGSIVFLQSDLEEFMKNLPKAWKCEENQEEEITKKRSSKSQKE